MVKIMINTFLAVLISFSFSSCEKDKQTIIDNEWQVESIKVHADSTLLYPSTGKVYIMSFESKKIDISRQYFLELDVNTCSGKVKFKNKNQVKFDSPECTYICCDSEFAENIIGILDKLNNYDINDSVLMFTGENGIIINLKKP